MRWSFRVCVGSRYLWGVPRIFERKTFNDHLITNDGNVFICRKPCPFMFREQSIRSSRDWRRNENSIMSKNCFVFIDLLSKFHKKAKIKHGLKSNWELEKAKIAVVIRVVYTSAVLECHGDSTEGWGEDTRNTPNTSIGFLHRLAKFTYWNNSAYDNVVYPRTSVIASKWCKFWTI